MKKEMKISKIGLIRIFRFHFLMKVFEISLMNEKQPKSTSFKEKKRQPNK